MIYLLFQGLVFNTNVLFLRSNALVPCLLFHLCHIFFCRDFSPVLPVATCCLEGGNKIDSVKCSCGYQKILKSEFYCLLWIVFSNTSRSVDSTWLSILRFPPTPRQFFQAIYTSSPAPLPYPNVCTGKIGRIRERMRLGQTHMRILG